MRGSGARGERGGENRKDRLDEDSVAQRRLFCYPAERTISVSLSLTRSVDPLFSPTLRVLQCGGRRGEGRHEGEKERRVLWKMELRAGSDLG